MTVRQSVVGKHERKDERQRVVSEQEAHEADRAEQLETTITVRRSKWSPRYPAHGDASIFAAAQVKQRRGDPRRRASPRQ